MPEARVALTQAHAAVLQGAIGRQRGVTQDTETEVVVCPLQRKNEATVAFPISENRVEAYCVGYRVDESAGRKKPEKPEGWLKYSRQDIATRIKRGGLSPRQVNDQPPIASCSEHGVETIAHLTARCLLLILSS